MTRREFLALLAALLAWPSTVLAAPATTRYWTLNVSQLGIDTVLAPDPSQVVSAWTLYLPQAGRE